MSSDTAPSQRSTPSARPYSGVDNLEVMREAVNYNRYLLELLRRSAPTEGKMLDFGAGTGTFALPMSEAGFDVTAVEPDELLRRRLQSQGVRTAADIASLPDSRFAFAYTLNVLEHIEADARALQQLYDKLAPGRTLLIYVPAFPLLFTSMDAKVGHIRRYTRRVLVERARNAGFAVEKVTYVDSLGFAATLLFKLIGNSSGDVNRSLLRFYDRWLFPLSRLLDIAVGRWLGKNLLLIGRKPA